MLRHRARAETIRRVGGLRVRQIDTVAREEHLHLVPFLGSGLGYEKCEGCSRGVVRARRRMDENPRHVVVLRLVVTA